MPTKVAIVLNLNAGGANGGNQIQTISDAFEKVGVSAEIHQVKDGEQFSKAINLAADSDTETVVAAGGDGTVSAVAAKVAETGKILGVLPLGTLNHFSKDLGIPQDLNEAAKVIADHSVKQVDVAEVTGRYFINNSSIGLYPQLVRQRELQQRLGRGKWWAAFWAALRLLRVSPFQKVTLDLDGKELRRKTPFVFVGNNCYEMDLYKIGTRPRLDEGKLSIYLLRRGGRAGLFLLILRTIVGRLRQSKDFEEFYATRLIVETRKRRVLVAMDGEVTVAESPLEYRIHPRKLRVIVPKEKE